MSVVLRPAGLDELDDLAVVASASFRSAFGPIVGAGPAATRDPPWFRERFQRSWQRINVGLIDGTLAGYTQVSDAHIDLLFIDPAAQGRGLGRALLRRAEAEGAASLECFALNWRARGFYERAGWRPTLFYRRPFIGTPHDFVLYLR